MLDLLLELPIFFLVLGLLLKACYLGQELILKQRNKN
jgi:hypothetical protein